MLSRILSACQPATKPCVQFVACGKHVSASEVTMSACEAAAAILGRSLLVDARIGSIGEDDREHPSSPVPDAFVSGLHHYHLAHSLAELRMVLGRDRRNLLNSIVDTFPFVAIDSGTPNSCPAASALAPMCNGAVLVVRAGRSDHAAIKDAALQITRAGGRIIGAVLDDAPARLPHWIRQP